MTDTLEAPAKRRRSRQSEPAPLTGYCGSGASFSITGTLRIMNFAALSSGSATLTPCAGFDVTLVSKICQTPVRQSVPSFPGGVPANTYCQDGHFTFDYATTGCDGTFSFSVSDAMVAVLFPGHVIANPSFSCIAPPTSNPYCILDPSRPQDYTGTHYGRGDIGSIVPFVTHNFNTSLTGTVNNLTYLDGCVDGVANDFVGAGYWNPCTGGSTSSGDFGYCQDIGAGFFLPDSTHPFSGIALRTFPSQAPALNANLLSGSVTVDLCVDTVFHVLCTCYGDTGWCPVPGASVTITDDCGNTETQTSNSSGLASYAHVNLRRIVDVTTSFTGDCDSFSPTTPFPTGAKGMIYPDLDDLSETFWKCDETIVYSVRPPVEAVVLDCTTGPAAPLHGDVLAHRVGHWVANGNSVIRAWHPDFRLSDTFIFDPAGDVSEARLAMEPHVERLSVVYARGSGDDPTAYNVYRRYSHDWGATWKQDPDPDTPLIPNVRHAVEVENYRGRERCDLYQDASEIDDDTLLPTGRGKIQCAVYDALSTLVGIFPADGLGIGGLLADDTTFSAYYEPEPGSYLACTFASFGERKVYRSYDDGRTWSEWTADVPPAEPGAGEGGDLIFYDAAG